MASLGCRVGRGLPRLYNLLARQSAAGQPNILRRVGLDGQMNHAIIRQMVISAARPAQAEQKQENLEATEEKDNRVVETRTRNRQQVISTGLDKLLYKIDIEVKRTGRVHHVNLQSALDSVIQENFCTSTQALLMLRCCGDLLTDESKQARTERLNHIIGVMKKLIKFDISHYNAILKVHLENENKIVASDFLAELEANNVQPNRVTFQHLIGLYCMEGNISGATTVLEHMKQEDMAINDSVFHSLLHGHALNKDLESLEATLEVMENSGLLPGAETYTYILTGFAKAKDWDKVEEYLVLAKNKEVQLDDGDYFKIMLALCENGMTEQAKGLVDKLPHRTAYFLEMRNALPQIIYAGCPDIAFDVYMGFSAQAKGGAQSVDKSGQGAFMTRALIKSGTSVEDCYDYTAKMVEDGYTESWGRLAEMAAESRTEQFCQQLGEKIGNNPEAKLSVSKLDLTGVVRKMGGSGADRSLFSRDEEEVLSYLRKLSALGTRHNIKSLSEVLSRMFDVTSMTPANLLHKLNENDDSLNWSLLYNCMIRAILNKEDLPHFAACTGLMLHIPSNNLYGDWWRQSLTRSYLKTRNMDCLISIVFQAVVSNRHKERFPAPGGDREYKDHARKLMGFLLEIDSQQVVHAPDTPTIDIVKPIVRELTAHKIGVPRDVAEKLNKNLNDPELAELLVDAVKYYEESPNYWTVELDKQFVEQRKELHKGVAPALRPRSRTPNYTGYFEVPSDINEMLKIKNLLKKRGETNNLLTDRIISYYAKNGQPQEAVAELREARAANDFHNGPTNNDLIIRGFIDAGNLEAARDFYRGELNEQDDAKVWANSCTNVALAHAKNGHIDKVLEILSEDLGNLKFINTNNTLSYMPLMDHYAEAGEVENLNKAFAALAANARKIPIDATMLAPLVQVHLAREDLNSAVAEFERLCLEYKKMPLKFRLTARLIEEEDVEAMQKVLDLSIGVIGEERSLYDLTHNFLAQGRRAQSKRLLETPGLRYNHGRVTYIMNQLIGSKKLDALEDFVLLSKNVFGCDRDFMFLNWVRAVKDDAKKVNDIWIFIQEEGHAPSNDLKIAVANSLTAGGLPVPFVTTDLDLGSQKNQTSAEETKEKPRQQPKVAQPKRPAKETPPPVLSPLDKAVAAKDVDAVIDSLKSQQQESLKSVRSGLDLLIKEEKFSEALASIEAMGYKSRLLQNTIKTALTGLVTSNKPDAFQEATSYVERMPVSDQKRVRAGLLMSRLRFSHDPIGFADWLGEMGSSAGQLESRRGEWLFNPTPVNETLQSNKQFADKMESLSSEGNLAATVFLGRSACIRGQTQEFIKYWNRHPSHGKESARDLIVDIDSTDRLSWIVSTLSEAKAPIEAFESPVNEALTKVGHNSDADLLAIAKRSVGELGVGLASINTTSLKRLADLDPAQFPEAKGILEARQVNKDPANDGGSKSSS